VRYPETRQDDIVDCYGSVSVADPYRWLEDLDSPEVAAWVAAQNACTAAHLAALPLRDHFRQRLTELWDHPRTSLPVVQGGRLFYAKNSGLERQAPIYVRSGVFDPPTIVLDPNALSPDGSVSVSQFAPSPDARWLAYASAEGGADWETVRIRNVSTGADLADTISWVRFSDLSWTHDSHGFFYSRYPEPPRNKRFEAALTGQAIYYHRLGTPQSADVLIYQRQDHPSWIVNAAVSEDGRYVFIRTYRGADHNNQLHFVDLAHAATPNITAPIQPLVETLDAEYAPIGNYQSRLYLRSDKGAPRRRIIAIDLENPEPSAWKVVVPEQPHVIENAALVGGRIVLHCLADVQSRLRVFALDGGSQGEIALPGIGAVSDLSGRSDGSDLWFLFSPPLSPATVYRFELDGQRRMAFEPPASPIDGSRFETRAMFATSKDGTRIPFFLSCRKDLPRDGCHPAMLFGYGGFSISVLPAYRPDLPAWLERGGVFVSVNARGGAEYGEDWQGRLPRQQAERVRRLHRRRRAPDPREHHVGRPAWHDRRFERRIAHRRGTGAAARSVPRRHAGRRRDGYAPLRSIHRREAVGDRVRLRVGSASVRRPDQVFAAAQPAAGNVLPGHADHHRRSRRPGRAQPLLQVRGGPPGRAGLRSAGADSRRDPGIARLSSNGSADRGAGRSMGVCRRPPATAVM
jgi:prolyl oligopeptidase